MINNQRTFQIINFFVHALDNKPHAQHHKPHMEKTGKATKLDSQKSRMADPEFDGMARELIYLIRFTLDDFDKIRKMVRNIKISKTSEA